MASIVVCHTVSMGHRLPSYDGICRSPHGHNVRVEAELSAPAFLDFKEAQDALRAVLAPLDHAMVLHRADPLLPVLRAADANFRLVALSVEPTTEALASLVFNDLWSTYGAQLKRVTVHETDKYAAVETCWSSAVHVEDLP